MARCRAALAACHVLTWSCLASGGDSAGWAPPGPSSLAILAGSPPRCADLFKDVVSDADPALLQSAVTAKQRRKYGNLSWVVEAFGEIQLQVAHPSYHVLSEGNVETTRPLADFVTDMAYHSSTNASFAFDQVADIGRDLEFKRVPESLKDAEVKQVFSLGSDGAGLGIHSHGATFLALLHGQKLWFIAPPDAELDPALLDPVHAHGLQLKRIVDSLEARSCNPASTSEDALACASTAERSSGLRGLVQCLQEPGTALYLPTMWLHATLNVGDAVAFALQGNMFAGAHEVDMPEQLARGSAESLSYNLIFCLNENRMDEALTLARRMIEVAPRDLRPHFYVAEILGISGAGAEAAEQMEKAVEVALALAAEEPPAPKELVAVWLLRIAYTFCGPLESIPRGAEIVAQALDYDANALVGHQIGNILEECSSVAQEMAQEMEP